MYTDTHTDTHIYVKQMLNKDFNLYMDLVVRQVD